MDDAGEVMYMAHMKLTEIPKLEKTTKKAILYRNQITKMDIEESPVLEELDLSDNKIKAIESLSSIPNIKVLDLNFNLISKVNLKDLKELRELYLICNDIDTFPELDLPKLNKLDVASNNIRKMGDTRKVESLQELYLANNYITEIENISNLKNLTILGLQNNSFVEIDCMKLPKSIKTLLLNENRHLERILNLEYLENLLHIDLEKTKIKKEDLNLNEKVIDLVI